ncbi:alkaline phosphatase D family protein [soil metagenome]
MSSITSSPGKFFGNMYKTSFPGFTAIHRSRVLAPHKPSQTSVTNHLPFSFRRRGRGDEVLRQLLYILFLPALFLSACSNPNPATEIDLHSLPLLVGEVTQQSAIFQARLTATDTLIFADIHHPDSLASTDLAGKAGVTRFEIAENASFSSPLRTAWLTASPQNDFIVKKKVEGLEPATSYYYRLEYGADSSRTKRSGANSFRTFPPKDAATPVSFVVVTGSHFERFYLGGGFGQASSQGAEAYRGEDKYLGFPGFESIARLQPDFFIGNGDNVYYDHPIPLDGKGPEEMRAKWHRQFAMPRIRQLFRTVPTYWLKDDHDHRYDDSDTVRVHDKFGAFPTHEAGVSTFVQQVPVTDPAVENPVTYRTVRVNGLLQLWLVEGRDYRSPNSQPDGPDKTIWGEEQKQWLKRTLQESDATFKLLISPTPMVGPDDASKRDNHVNHAGFRTEGDAFFAWLQENSFRDKNFYILCGDRHWQYHSVHPSGFEEFSSGALVDQNARLGRNPGDPKSSDPQGLIKQPYTQQEASGGFLKVEVSPGKEKGASTIAFVFYDENGVELYREEKLAAAGRRAAK